MQQLDKLRIELPFYKVKPSGLATAAIMQALKIHSIYHFGIEGDARECLQFLVQRAGGVCGSAVHMPEQQCSDRPTLQNLQASVLALFYLAYTHNNTSVKIIGACMYIMIPCIN